MTPAHHRTTLGIGVDTNAIEIVNGFEVTNSEQAGDPLDDGPLVVEIWIVTCTMSVEDCANGKGRAARRRHVYGALSLEPM